MDSKESSQGIKPKHIALFLAVTFTAVLAVVIGKKMSTEAMAVVIGIVCGGVASIPTTALLTLLLTRRDRQKEEEPPVSRQGAYPPVVVIQGGAPNTALWATGRLLAGPGPGPLVQREFHVVGDEEMLP